MDKDEIKTRLEQIRDKISSKGIPDREKEEILSELDAILDVDPNNTDALFMKGVVLQFCKNYEEAIGTYQSILAINPGDEIIKESISMCEDLMKMNYGSRKEISNSVDNSVVKTPSILEKISIWHILIIKVIILAGIIYLFFMPLFTGN